MLGCRDHHGSEYAGSRVGLVRGGRQRSRNRRGQTGDRHEFEFAECRQAFCFRVRGAWLRLCGTHQYRVVKWAPGMPPCTSCAGEPNRLSRAPDRIFKVMGKNIAHAGAVGDGQTCKVVNQIIVALNIQAVSEALVFAPKAGADPGKVRAALMGGFASSKILEVHAERMIKRTFDPGFRIELH